MGGADLRRALRVVTCREPGAVPVALAAGVLLSGAYVLTRRLWLPIGIHFAWDFMQDGVFGASAGAKGILRAELAGPSLLSGGGAGIEGSILALAVVLISGLYLLLKAKQQGRLIGPSWRRRGVSSQP